MQPPQFASDLSDTVARAKNHEVLLFIHKYNANFQSALLPTSELTNANGFNGTTVCYSWLSQAEMLDYTIDESMQIVESEWTTRLHSTSSSPKTSLTSSI